MEFDSVTANVWFSLARVALAPSEQKTAACHSLPMQLDALPNGRRFPGPFSTLGRSCPCNNFLHRHVHEQRPWVPATIFVFSAYSLWFAFPVDAKLSQSPVVDAKLSQALSSLETRMGKDTDGKDTDGKRTPSKCESCLCTIKDEDVLALQCVSGHVLCGECSPVYAESVLAQGMTAFPPKCSVCRAGIPLGSFERILKPEQVKCGKMLATVLR